MLQHFVDLAQGGTYKNHKAVLVDRAKHWPTILFGDKLAGHFGVGVNKGYNLANHLIQNP